MSFKDMSRWKQRVIFFLIGLLVSFLCGLILFYWMELIRLILREPGFIYDDQTKSMLMLNIFIKNIPLLAIGAVIILRVIKGKQFRVISYILGTVTPYVVLTAFLFLGPEVGNYMHSKTFDAELWRNQSAMDINDWPPRLCMVDDLISSQKLEGLTRQQVIALLGEPEEFNLFDFGDPPERCIIYYLGPERGLIRIDSEWLHITFKENGKVDRYLTVKD